MGPINCAPNPHPSRGGNQTTYWCDITGTGSSKPVNKESNTPTYNNYNPFDWSMKQTDKIFHWSIVSEGIQMRAMASLEDFSQKYSYASTNTASISVC